MRSASLVGSHGEWLSLWQDARQSMGKSGEYAQAERRLEVWGQFSQGGSIEISTVVEQWRATAEEIRAQKFRIGLVAVRLPADDICGSPGVTIVVETPLGGSNGARILMNLLSSLGIGGILARQECKDRWGVIKLIYCPAWYAVTDDKTFGIDWSRRGTSAHDENEFKRLWCQHVVRAVKRITKEMPSALVDSLFFDCYALCDRLHEMSDAALNQLAATDWKMLARYLITLQEK